MTSGQEIRESRKRMGLTQEELGAHLGAHPVTICRWETEFYHAPDSIGLALKALESKLNAGVTA